jgi:hypothetical protein
MEESRKTNIIIGLLLAIFAVLIFAVLILAQVNFTHRSDFTAVAMSKDGVKMNVSYTVKFNAPLIIPSKIRKEAEWKMKIYGTARFVEFCILHNAQALIKRDLGILQTEFDECGNRSFINMCFRILGGEDFDRIKSVKIRNFEYYIFEGEPRHEKQPTLPQMFDTVKNVLITLNTI